MYGTHLEVVVRRSFGVPAREKTEVSQLNTTTQRELRRCD